MKNKEVIDKSCCGPGYSSPSEAIKAPNEKLLYTIAIYTGTGIQKPDYLATIDVESAARARVGPLQLRLPYRKKHMLRKSTGTNHGSHQNSTESTLPDLRPSTYMMPRIMNP